MNRNKMLIRPFGGTPELVRVSREAAADRLRVTN